jgi:hypothetical protein
VTAESFSRRHVQLALPIECVSAPIRNTKPHFSAAREIPPRARGRTDGSASGPPYRLHCLVNIKFEIGGLSLQGDGSLQSLRLHARRPATDTARCPDTH